MTTFSEEVDRLCRAQTPPSRGAVQALFAMEHTDDDVADLMVRSALDNSGVETALLETYNQLCAEAEGPEAAAEYLRKRRRRGIR